MKHVLVVLLLSLAAFVSGSDEKITATGYGPTEKEAVWAAQRDAVERGVGVYVEAGSVSLNNELLEDKVLSKARGFVKGYAVISKEKMPDGNWKVVIQCEVAVGNLKNSLDALRLLKDKMGNPPLMIVYDKSAGGDLPTQYEAVIQKAYDGLSSRLAERDFTVIAATEAEDGVYGAGRDHPVPEKYRNQLITDGRKQKAEYLVLYHVKPMSGGRTDTFIKTWVMISAKIIDLGNGRELAGHTCNVQGVDRFSEEFAANKAGIKAGRLMAKFLEDKLAQKWQMETQSGRPILLFMENVTDFSMVSELVAKLKKVYAVKNVFPRFSEGNQLHYEIAYVGDTDTLKNTLAGIIEHMGLTAKPKLIGGDALSINFAR